MCVSKKSFNNRESISFRLTRKPHPWHNNILLQGVYSNGKWATLAVSGPQASYLASKKAGDTVLFHAVQTGTVRIRNPKNGNYYTNKKMEVFSPRQEHAAAQYAIETSKAKAKRAKRAAAAAAPAEPVQMSIPMTIGTIKLMATVVPA